MRRSLLKVARTDAVKACSSKRSERHVVGVRFPALVKQARLEDFRVMCIESRSNLGDLAFLRKMQRRWGRTSFRDHERLEKKINVLEILSEMILNEKEIVSNLF